jgi:DNA-binding LytR/AlgR family response regulator
VDFGRFWRGCPIGCSLIKPQSGVQAVRKKNRKSWLPPARLVINPCTLSNGFPLMSTPVLLTDSVFVVTTSQRYEKIAKNDILYVQAEGSWVDIVTADKTYRLSTNLGQIEPQLDTKYFERVSRKYIVNLHHIEAVHGSQLFIRDMNILIGKQYRDGLLSRLPILRTKFEPTIPNQFL